MTTFDLTAAKAAAAAKRDADLNEAAGAAGNALDTFLVKVAESDLSGPEKVAFFSMIETNAKGLFETLTTGKAAPKALGGSPSGDPDDLQDELDAAEAENAKLNASLKVARDALKEVLGSAPNMVDGSLPASTVRDVKAKLDETKANAASGAGVVRKDAVKAKADEAKAKMAATKTAYGDRHAKDVAMAAIEEVISLVS